MLRALMSSGSFSGTPACFICWYFYGHLVSTCAIAMRLSFPLYHTLNNCPTCSLVIPGGSILPLLPCCGMPWLGCTAAMLSSCSFSNLSQSILYATMSSDRAPIVQLIISHARLLGQRGVHPVWAHDIGQSKVSSAVDSSLSGPAKPSAQSAELAGLGWWLLRGHGGPGARALGGRRG
jgi:hypothetical protein